MLVSDGAPVIAGAGIGIAKYFGQVGGVELDVATLEQMANYNPEKN